MKIVIQERHLISWNFTCRGFSTVDPFIAAAVTKSTDRVGTFDGEVEVKALELQMIIGLVD